MGVALSKYRILAYSILAAILVAVSSILMFGGFFENWHLKLTHFWYGHEVREDIVIVDIDPKTTADPTGFGTALHWREAFSVVTQHIEEGNPSVIGFDVVFDQPAQLISQNLLKTFITESSNSDELKGILEKVADNSIQPIDTFFANVLSAYDNIVLAQILVPSKALHQGYIAAQSMKNIIPILSQTSRIAIISVADSKDVIYAFPVATYVQATKKLFESFPVLIARMADKQTQELPEQITDRYFDIPVRDGLFKINFAGPAYSYQYYSLADVYHKKVPTSSFKDKIVLIGASDILFQDLFFTPTSEKNPMPGVEIHANAIQTILDKRFLRDVTPTESVVILAILAILIIGLSIFLPVIAGVGVVAVLGVIYTFIAKLAFGQGIILNMLYPYVVILAGFTGAYLIRFFMERKTRKHLQGAFGKFISKDIVKDIAENLTDVQAGGEKILITTLFSDIKSFTSTSEKLTPEQLVTFLNEYLGEMTKIVQLHNGTIDKFEGDAVMAFWGAPQAMTPEESATLACQTARDMQKRLAELNTKWQQQGLGRIEVRIGIHTGHAIVGNIGAAGRLNYTAIGDNINLASRLEGANKYFNTSILVSEDTAKAIASTCTVRELDFIRVKGKQQPVRVYEVIAMQSAIHPTWQQILADYAKGLQLYRELKFTEAHAIFSSIATRAAHDGPTQTMLARCAAYAKNPPPAGWDGVYTLEGK